MNPPSPATAPPLPRRRSKTLAAWTALLFGSLGLHRFYLHGPRDAWAWLHVPLTLAGWVGVQRLRQIGQDDPVAWGLVPLFGLMISLGAFFAILYGLTPDEKWDARHNRGLAPRATRWGPVLAAILALLVGGGIFMGSITYGMQMLFEWQLHGRAAAGGG
jgi:hypothetical protein